MLISVIICCESTLLEVFTRLDASPSFQETMIAVVDYSRVPIGELFFTTSLFFGLCSERYYDGFIF